MCAIFKSNSLFEAWDSVLRIFDIHVSEDIDISIPSDMKPSVQEWINGTLQKPNYFAENLKAYKKYFDEISRNLVL